VSFNNRTFPEHGAVVQIVWPRVRFETLKTIADATA
jgi:two-component system sensor histidine kinase RegB